MPCEQLTIASGFYFSYGSKNDAEDQETKNQVPLLLYYDILILFTGTANYVIFNNTFTFRNFRILAMCCSVG